jgi:hypothetical protein
MMVVVPWGVSSARVLAMACSQHTRGKCEETACNVSDYKGMRSRSSAHVADGR